MRIALSTLGGIGDTLMLTMPAKRLKELNENIIIDAYGRPDSIRVLQGNKLFNDIKPRKSWNHLPLLNNVYDAIIEFKYCVKTFILKEDTNIKFDLPLDEICKRQREFELDLWVNDIDYYRMPKWFDVLEKEFMRRGVNWIDIIRYFSGLNFNETYLSVEQEKPNFDLPNEYIAISSPNYFNGFSKLWEAEKWNKVFEAFPDKKFVILGTVVNKMLKGKNIIRLEGLTKSLQQLAYVLAHCEFLISDEGGLVHLAKAVNKKSIVLFGATPKWFFGYRDNINLRGESECKRCIHKHFFWFKRCKLSKDSPFCLAMQNLQPETVIEKVKEII